MVARLSRGKRCFVFELKNVSVEFWKDAPKGQHVPWSQLVETARTTVHQSEAEVCDLEYRASDQGFVPVQKTLDDASTQLRNHLKMMKELALVEGPLVGFVIVRVGLFRLISRRVTIE